MSCGPLPIKDLDYYLDKVPEEYKQILRNNLKISMILTTIILAIIAALIIDNLSYRN